LWQDDPERFDRMLAVQAQTAREREWGYMFPDDAARQSALKAVEAHFVGLGAQSRSRMDNGYDLEATMMRRGMPFEVAPDTVLAPHWLQVCQRISQSEDGLARWEVVADEAADAAQAKADIAVIAQRFGAGEEYQG
jgi:phosphomannomutase